MTLTEILEKTDDIGAIQARGCQILCLLSVMAHNDATDDDHEQLQKLLDQFQAARDWLDKGLMAALNETGCKPDSTFKDTVTAAADQVKSVTKRLRMLSHDMSDPGIDGAIRELMADHVNHLTPSYQAVLHALDELEDQTETESHVETRKIIKGALGELEQINSTINLIAVNASIEAARVGDQGRGFAVISTEIQALSKKSRGVVDNIKANLS